MGSAHSSRRSRRNRVTAPTQDGQPQFGGVPTPPAVPVSAPRERTSSRSPPALRPAPVRRSSSRSSHVEPLDPSLMPGEGDGGAPVVFPTARSSVDNYMAAYRLPEFLQAITEELTHRQPENPYGVIQERVKIFAQALAEAPPGAVTSPASVGSSPGMPSGRPRTPLRCSVGKIPSLNVVILVVGSRGDVQPFLAFALSLRRRGHRVRLASHVRHRQLVEEVGNLEYFPLSGDPEELMRFMSEHPEMISLNRREIESAKHMMFEIYQSAYLACTTSTTAEPYVPDVIISNPPVHAHIHIAEKLQVPLQIMFTMPWTPTEEYQHPMASVGAGVLYGNRKSYFVVDGMVWLGCGPQINRLRTEILGLPLCENGATLIHDLCIPHTYCMSPSLVPKPADWGPHIDVVGFWFLDLSSSFDPKAKVPRLVQFLESGPPPLYVGFGSIVVDDPQSLSRRVVEGVIKSGVRAIIHQGWAKLGEGMAVGEDIFLLKDAVPHDWLFPLCSAVCHHGGAGTVAAGLRVGKPTMVVPFFGYQPFWGACVARKRVGPNPIPHRRLTPDNMAEAIRFCMLPETQAAAAELALKIASEDGVEAGVDVFERRLPVYNGRFKCEVYENQKRDYSGNWSAEALRGRHSNKFSDATGRLQVSMEGFQLPPGWQWDGPWEVERGPCTDDQGWEYALHWVDWHAPALSWDTARRRKWVRFRKPRSSGFASEGSSNAVLPFNSSTSETSPTRLLDSQGPAPNEPKVVYLTALRATGLPDVGGMFSNYLFLRMSLRRGEEELQVQRTKVKTRSLNPVWDQTFYFLHLPEDVFDVECWSWN
eukprot:RCo006880